MTEMLRYGADQEPAPLTVAQLRARLADFPDDAVLRFRDYQMPEFSDWYTTISHLSAVTDDGELVLRSNADYSIWDEGEDEDEDEDVESEEDQNARQSLYTAPAKGPDNLFDWERELLQPDEAPADQAGRA